jgi:hypothetical protein
MKAKEVSERVKARLGLRSSNAATPHKNQARSTKLPGKGDRRKQQAAAIRQELEK